MTNQYRDVFFYVVLLLITLAFALCAPWVIAHADEAPTGTRSRCTHRITNPYNEPGVWVEEISCDPAVSYRP